MSKIYNSITELVGRTPLLRINNYLKAKKLEADILVKIEYYNPNQSVKDRAALAMIEDAERKGLLKPGYTIVEATSGNTGIGLAGIAAAKGYKFRVYMPGNVSKERFQVVEALGGEAIDLLSVPEVAGVAEDTGGDAIAMLDALEKWTYKNFKNVYLTAQAKNQTNPEAHFNTTGPEIWNDTDGKVDIFVGGVGTGGTVSGTGRYLKSQNQNIKIVAVQPGYKSIPSAENPTPEEITGIHPFEEIPLEQIPATLDRDIYDERYLVETNNAYKAARELAKYEGILVGASSGAALYAATEIARRPENKGKTIVALLPDTGLRYLTTNLFNKEYSID